ncbi:MAG: ATP-binding protein, partial [Polaromonas sp.]
GVAGELPEVVKNLVGIAKNNCERLIRLINGILDIEKIESGKMRLELQVVQLEPLLQQALTDNEGFAVQHRVKLRLQGPDTPLKLHVDRDRLIQVLTNLLSNAVKFSPTEGVVEVKVLRVAQGVRIEVVDQGPGIAEEFRSRIFRKFSQADSSDTRPKGGSGLGLNISKAIVDQMGGQIGFLSEPGAGATFFLELPEWQDPAPLIARKPGQLPRQGIIGGKPLVLHVEDNPDIQQLTAAVAHEVADFEFAATLNEARLRLSEQRFDLVVLDLGLGEESGWDLLGDINALFPRPPVIVFSARDAGRVEGKQIEAVLLQSHTTNAELLHAIERALRIPAEH